MTIERVTLNDPEARSTDPVGDNITALKALFPAAVADGRIDFDTLRQLLGDEVDDGDERYGLNWPGKRRARRLALTPSTGTLRPAREDSVDWDTTRNLMIEGDNLEVLKLLQKSYSRRVDTIYIDPPYNKDADVIYKDDYSTPLNAYNRLTGQRLDDGTWMTSSSESSGRYHGDWMSMMYPRLMIAKSLLAPTGVLFISIDKAEVANLTKMTQEIFGESNVLGALPTIMNLKGNNDAFGFSDTHEFTLVCLSDKARSQLFELPVDDDVMDAWLEDEIGLYKRADTLRRTGQDASRVRRPKGWFPVYISGGNHVYVTDDDEPSSADDEELWPINDDGAELSWTWGKQKIKEEPHNLIIVRSGGRPNIYKKQRPGLGALPSAKPKSTIYKPAYSSSNGTAELKALFGRNVFDSPPKPRTLVSDLIRIGCPPKGVVMDFFAGTGTTGHAVMGLNAQGHGDRQFILVQIPQPLDVDDADQREAAQFLSEIGRPCAVSEITAERLRRAANKLKSIHPNMQADLGFRAYKLASSNLRPWEPSNDLAGDLLAGADNIVQDRTEDDLLTELLLKQGIDLTEPMVTETITGAPVYVMGGGVLVVCLAPVTAAGAEALADGIADWIQRLNPVSAATIFFKDSGFENDVAKANVAAILEQRLDDKLLKVRSL